MGWFILFNFMPAFLNTYKSHQRCNRKTWWPLFPSHCRTIQPAPLDLTSVERKNLKWVIRRSSSPKVYTPFILVLPELLLCSKWQHEIYRTSLLCLFCFLTLAYSELWGKKKKACHCLCHNSNYNFRVQVTSVDVLTLPFVNHVSSLYQGGSHGGNQGVPLPL